MRSSRTRSLWKHWSRMTTPHRKAPPTTRDTGASWLDPFQEGRRWTWRAATATSAYD